ncbi:MAG: hypothetical protein WA309_15610, partial [Pseudolabrys sp.]
MLSGPREITKDATVTEMVHMANSTLSAKAPRLHLEAYRKRADQERLYSRQHGQRMAAAIASAPDKVSSGCRWRVMPQAQWLQTIWRIQPSSE